MLNENRFHSRKLVEEPFHNKGLLRDTWDEAWGVHNEFGRIQKLLMHTPGEEVRLLSGQDAKMEESGVIGEALSHRPSNNQSDAPDLTRLREQHQALVRTLQEQKIEIVYLEGIPGLCPEQLFVRDMGLVVPGGVILSRLALYLRYPETRAAARTFGMLGMPVLGHVHGGGLAEGGSFMLLNRETAIIGRSERVNLDGIEQIRHLLAVQNIRLLTVELPASIIHLDEAFLMLDRHHALVDSALLPYWFLDELDKQGIAMLHVDPSDPPLAINALTVAPGRIIMSSSAARTIELLRQRHFEVIPVDITEIEKLGGGIHCLTLPLIREY